MARGCLIPAIRDRSPGLPGVGEVSIATLSFPTLYSPLGAS